MMRPALACLTAALLAAAGTAALAQSTTDQTAPGGAAPAAPMAQPAPGAAMPGQAPAAVGQPAPGAVPAETPAPGQAPVTAGAPPADAAPAAPPVPQTSEAGNYALQFLNEVCLPLIHQGDLKQITKAKGFRQSRGFWTLKLAEGRTITLTPPTKANPTTCSLDIAFDVDQWRPIVETLNNWAYTHNPPVALLYQGYRPLSGATTTWSWNLDAPEGKLGLAFNVPKKPNGQPMGGKYDIGTLLVTDTRPSA